MQPKLLCLAITIGSLITLTGCAANASTQATSPVPQALIQAAEQASHARMVFADIQARLHGGSVETVRLETPDSGVPDFMLATVRLDYNGPMAEVLNRLANDIGYRVNEYAMPASGLSYSPWMRASGNKRLIDHLKEMNSQVPWHIVLDHENRRLVIDYSAEGGMAQQIRSAHAAEAARNSSGSYRQTLPNAERIRARASEAVQQELSSNPVYVASEANSSRSQAPLPQVNQASEQWYVAIEGYSDKSTAESMVNWLAEDDLVAYVKPVSQGYDVRIRATNSRDAIAVRDHLRTFDVPSSVGVEGDSVNASNSPTTTRPPVSSNSNRNWQVSGSSNAKTSPSEGNAADRDFTGMSSQQIAENVIVDPALEPELNKSWRTQLAFGKNLSSFGRLVSNVANAGYEAVLHPEAGGYHLRVNGFTSRDTAEEALGVLKSKGFGDAYTLAPMRG